MAKKVTKKKVKKARVSPANHIKKHAKKVIGLPKRIWSLADNTFKKIILIILIITLILVIIYIATNIFVLVNFLLGNDTLVKLTTSHQDFYLKNGNSDFIEFGMFISTNIFCEATCGYSFEDLSTGELIDSGTFSTKLANPNKKKYRITAPETGVGQKLYRFEMRCSSKDNGLCKTEEKEKKRSFLIALNYELNKNQSILREKAYSKLSSIIKEDSTVNKLKLENNYLYNKLTKVIFLDNTNDPKKYSIEGIIDSNLNDWDNYEYSSVINASVGDQINTIKAGLLSIQSSLNKKAKTYNLLIDSLKTTKIKASLLQRQVNLTLEDLSKINKIIIDYNILSDSFRKKFDIEDKNKSLKKLKQSIEKLNLSLNGTSEIVFEMVNISSKFPEKIKLNKTFNYESNFTIGKERPSCCYKGNCQKCCDESCVNDRSKYPVILLHGHSFNTAISAEKSLGDLSEIQDKLSTDGFLDGGYLILRGRDSRGTFSKTNQQIVFAASYYFDIYKNKKESVSLQTQSDDINTYALRLNDIIKSVKGQTERNKVYIVAHSMGGLVSRRYIQIYGEDEIEKLIMIGTPNNGIDGTILSGCSVLGANSHCEDMDKDSLLINKLTYGEIPKINVTTIIGRGCEMNDEDGDGITKVKSAELEWAKNIYIDGSCEGFSFLHNNMLNPEQYPEVYNAIKKEILN